MYDAAYYISMEVVEEYVSLTLSSIVCTSVVYAQASRAGIVSNASTGCMVSHYPSMCGQRSCTYRCCASSATVWWKRRTSHKVASTALVCANGHDCVWPWLLLLCMPGLRHRAIIQYSTECLVSMLYADLAKAVDMLKRGVLESVVKERFGSQCCRMYRMVSKHQNLEERQVMGTFT